ncbi:MAG: tetratricopeptide repeat protein [Anaerolineae bacterium]|nr:tetratricopeptide repeat protein [Anaerolineae bacterium]
MPTSSPGVNHLQRAADLIALRRYDKAIEEARRALRQDPDAAEAHRLLAWALWAQGELSRAEFAARAAAIAACLVFSPVLC